MERIFKKLHASTKAFNGYVFSLLFMTLILNTSCSTKVKNLVPITENEAETLNLLSTTKENNPLLNLSKGSSWQTWLKIHEECTESNWFKNPVYLGTSNSIDLGSIIHKRSFQQRNKLDDYVLTEEERAFIIPEVVPSSCISHSINASEGGFTILNDLGELLGFDFEFLKEKSSDLTANITTYAIEDILIDRLQSVLKDSNAENKSKKAYKESLYKKNSRIVTKVLRVKDINIDVTSNKQLIFDIESKINDLKNTDSTKNKFNINYKKLDSLSLQIVIPTEIVVFGVLHKPE